MSEIPRIHWTGRNSASLPLRAHLRLRLPPPRHSSYLHSTPSSLLSQPRPITAWDDDGYDGMRWAWAWTQARACDERWIWGKHGQTGTLQSNVESAFSRKHESSIHMGISARGRTIPMARGRIECGLHSEPCFLRERCQSDGICSSWAE